MLRRDEQDAVRGDFAESGETSGKALWDLLGLIVRRHSTPWKDWRHWLGLAGLVIPAAVLLGQISIAAGHLFALYFGGSLNHTSGMTRSVVGTIVSLVSLSFGAGFALGFLSRRTMWVNGTLFYLFALSALLLPMGASHPAYLDLMKGSLYRTASPLATLTVLFLLPSMWGLQQGLQKRQWLR